jgi:hypothetical protein
LSKSVSKPLSFFSQGGGGEHFRVDGSVVTISVYLACAQNLVTAWASKAGHTIPNTEDTPPGPLQQKTVWGIYIYIYGLGPLTPLVPGWGTGPEKTRNPECLGFALYWLLVFVRAFGTGPKFEFCVF